MLDLTGYYLLLRSCGKELLLKIVQDSNGDFVSGQGDSTLGNVPINGHLDTTTYAITFNDQQTPGFTIDVSFYSGFAVSGDGLSPCYLAGTYHETVFTFTNASPPRPGGFSTVQRSWYATYQGPTE
jgi:hypothetical protein